jgi:hypothetical protein
VDIRDGTLTALYLFDVAEHIDLPRLREVSRLKNADCRLQIHGLQIADCRFGLPIADLDCGLPIADCRFDCRLLISIADC